MMLHPEVGRSMQLMKYALNHPKYFTHEKIAFGITFVAFVINILAELLNLFMLLYQTTIQHCIIHLVTLEIIIEIPHIYMGSLMDDHLKDRLFEQNAHLHVHNKSSTIPWSSRSMSNKLGKMIYRIFRILYVSVIFYFQPFLLMFVYHRYVKQGDFPKAGGAHWIS